MPKLPDQRAQDNPWPEYPRVCKTDYGQQEAIAKFGKDPRRYRTTISGILTNESGWIQGVKTVRMDFDEQGKYSPVADSEEMLDCDLLIIAAGFTGCRKDLAETFGLELSARNTIKTEQGKYASNVPGVFAAGDVRRGQSLVVWAIAEGRECAKEVDLFLEGYTNL